MRPPRVLLPLCGALPGALPLLFFAGAAACGPAGAPPQGHVGPDLRKLFPEPSTAQIVSTAPIGSAAPIESARATASSTSATAATAPAPCFSDDDCGYDPRVGHCGTDPAYNKQPPLLDQGLVCYCQKEESACALLRVEPAPCEGDTSCAVRADPRPHPVRATAEHPHEKLGFCTPPRGNAPRVTQLYATCERTNICTLQSRECARP
jgi:hypothetical protein